MLLKKDTIAVAALYQRLDGSPVLMLVETRGCEVADRPAMCAALAQRFAEIGLGVAVCVEGEVRITIRRLPLGSDGETIDSRPSGAKVDRKE